ncbi:MAG: GumC family protein [bacterium]|nr:GumC family protein [bacterium]
MNPAEKQTEGNLRDIMNIIFRHKKKVFLTFSCIWFLIVVWTMLLPEYYNSEAKLLIKLGRESVALDPTATTGQTIQITQPREFELNSELEILKSREIAERVVRAIGVERVLFYPDEEILGDTSTTGQARDIVREGRRDIRSAIRSPMQLLAKWDLVEDLNQFDSAVISIMNDLIINVQETSNIISVSFEARKPRLAHDIISRLIEYYLEKHIDVHRTSGSYEFFEAQTDTLAKQLAITGSELLILKNQTGIASIDEQRTLLINRISGLKEEKASIDVELAASRNRVVELTKLKESVPTNIEMNKITGINNTAYGFMKQSLFNLQLKEQDLLSKYKEDNKFIVEVRRQIKEAETLLSTEKPTHTQITRGINSAYQQVVIDLNSEISNRSSLEAKSEAMTALLSEAQGELTYLNENELEITELVRTQNIQESNYSEYTRNLEQARIDQALQLQKISNISIVQPASLPMKTSRPNKLQNIMLGFLFALFGCTGAAFFAEYIDNSIKSPEDVRAKLQLETIVVIAKYPKT